MVEAIFERSDSATRRLAAVRAASIVTLYGLSRDFRHDLEQEALLELWRKRTAYDPRRGGWHTFSERVVANRLTSLVRSMHSQRSGQFREEPLENVPGLAAPEDCADLRTNIYRVLAGALQFDRHVALCLIGHSAVETGQRLGVSRAAVYRAIGRLRTAFTKAGLSPRGRDYGCDTARATSGE